MTCLKSDNVDTLPPEVLIKAGLILVSSFKLDRLGHQMTVVGNEWD